MSQDFVQRFLFKDLGIRGQVLRLDDAWQKMILDRHYPRVIAKLLGDLSLVTILMAAGLKHRGKVTIQVQGTGPVNLLVVEVTDDLKIRGVAKTKVDLKEIPETATLDELLGDGQILTTLENTQTHHHFQSYVPREADTIAGCFETFFQQSEQLETRLWLATDAQNAGGLIIQKIPGDSHSLQESDEDIDAWNRIELLGNTVKDEELTLLTSEELLHRLFHEDVIELYDANTIEYHCPHDKERIDAMLIGLGEAEVRKILDEQGEIVIHNEICNFHARYNEQDIDALFAKANAESQGSMQ